MGEGVVKDGTLVSLEGLDEDVKGPYFRKTSHQEFVIVRSLREPRPTLLHLPTWDEGRKV